MSRLMSAALFTVMLASRRPAASAEPAIYTDESPSYLETLAAREVRRYVYLRTGTVLQVVSVTRLPVRASGVLVAERDRTVVKNLARGTGLSASLKSLRPQGYLIKTLRAGQKRIVLVAGSGAEGTLYGAYRLCEHFGIRFYLDGDVLPDGRIPFALPDVNETGRPLFALRGIQPFHDFPEGPDWWNLTDYRAIIQQLPKLRMNFLGLHTYPEPIAEPTVWIGRTADIGSEGRVEHGYPSSYQNTFRGDWGYARRSTSDFLFGASQLFDTDAGGADIMRDLCPKPKTTSDAAELFRRTGMLLRDVFGEARKLGIKTCAGTETPLVLPEQVRERFTATGADPNNPAAVRAAYEGIFKRAAETYPLDYYWLWTPEGWTWEGTKEEQVRRTIDDLKLAADAARAVNAPFQLATCGWVLGPPGDRALFDKALPKAWPVSCINRQVGNEPVDPAFAGISGRQKWAIPWLEDDPGLTAPQLWAGRMRRDAADARRYGCTGLMGIHWRTRVLGPNVSALAQAAWNQAGWSAPRQSTGPVGGQAAAFPGHAIAGTNDGELYRTVRYGMSAYRLSVPNGRYAVTLRFCEPHYGEPGKRVFDVSLNRRPVIHDLDIFARVGKDRALDYKFDDVRIGGGVLEIGFSPKTEFPSIAAIDVAGPDNFSLKINCGGPALGKYIADPPAANDYLPVGDFYTDWARAQFGPECGSEIGTLFERLDGRLPRPVEWTDGPGGLRPDSRPWREVSPEYAFVDDLAAFRGRIRGAGAKERFDYWLDTFRYLRAAAQLRCVWAELNRALDSAAAATDARTRTELARHNALPRRVELVTILGEVYRHLMATVSTTGELGTVANWEQHIRPELLDKTGKRLADLLGEPLPPEAQPAATYSGRLRIVLLPPPTHLNSGDAVDFKILVLTPSPVSSVALQWRPMGRRTLHTLLATHVGRGVYTVRLGAEMAKGEDLEYHITATTVDGRSACWPAGAPSREQTMVVLSKAPSRFSAIARLQVCV